ncbi:MAG: hypothetical protein E6J08_08055 [Chloroflexi bacterium]|nr:MAG: hypothetical protein E6J08_08055 [Chloroflexota bacterium]
MAAAGHGRDRVCDGPCARGRGYRRRSAAAARAARRAGVTRGPHGPLATAARDPRESARPTRRPRESAGQAVPQG